MIDNRKVLIVGGGLAGLSCALKLKELGISSQILEASDAVGGRARTDEVDGFLLDRGFQVLLTRYPETQRLLDYDDLNLDKFEPGALVRFKGKFHLFVDPWRKPQYFFKTAFSPVASFVDKIRIARLKNRLYRNSLQQVYERSEMTTLEFLQKEGFSSQTVERFFRPFLGGVFLERNLSTSSRKFEFVFKMFSEGHAALPKGGMGSIANQLASRLPEGAVRTNARVESLAQNSVVLAGGEKQTASKIILACDAAVAAKLLGKNYSTSWHGVTCLYFAAPKPPIDLPILILNGEGKGVINNLCVPSQISSNYAPAGQALISVTVLGTIETQEDLIRNKVLDELRVWFGSQVKHWKHLKSYHIPQALPSQSPPTLSPISKSTQVAKDIFCCGDYMDLASIQGALRSGRQVAEMVGDSIRKEVNDINSGISNV